MRFADFPWLFGIGYALAVGVMLILGGLALVRAMRRFGDEALVLQLTAQQQEELNQAEGGSTSWSLNDLDGVTANATVISNRKDNNNAGTINVTHDPVPALKWPPMTMHSSG